MVNPKLQQGGEGMDVRPLFKSDTNLPSGYLANPVVSSLDHPEPDHVVVEPLKSGVNLLHGYISKNPSSTYEKIQNQHRHWFWLRQQRLCFHSTFRKIYCHPVNRWAAPLSFLDTQISFGCRWYTYFSENPEIRFHSCGNNIENL